METQTAQTVSSQTAVIETATGTGARATEKKQHFTRFKWSSQSISVYFSYAVVGYVTYYCTDLIGLNAGIVGTLLLVSKILDAITNFIAATIVDNCHFKKGKARPWVIAIIPMWLSIILMFSIPAGWGTTAKYIMIFLMYSLVNAVFSTIISCVDNIYLKHAFLGEKERVSMSTVGSGLGMVSMVVGEIAMPLLISHFDTVPHGWTIMTAAIGIPMALFGSIRYFTIPEVDTDLTSADTQHVTIRDTLQAFFSNKYTILLMFMQMAIQIAAQFTGTPMTYYFKYIVGDVSKASIATAMAVPSMAIILFLPKLAEKAGRMRVIRIGVILSVLSYAALFFAGTNLPFICVTTLIHAAAMMPLTIFIGLMLIDSMDYDRWKNHRNLEGAVFAGTSLGTTIGNGIGASLSGTFLSAFGYDGSAAVQSAGALLGIRISISLLPAAITLFILILLLFYDLDKKMPTIHKDLAARDQAAAAERSHT